MAKEIEIKFRIANIAAVIRSLKGAGFRCVTGSTHEMNTLYDLPAQKLRKRGELLRLRKYGKTWVLTHKAKGKAGRHKTRLELQTEVKDGQQMDAILRALGFEPVFRYEKYRAEWSDGSGHVVLDKTPIGNFGEIEGSPRWIDRTASLLGFSHRDYITRSYGYLYLSYCRERRIWPKDMLFKDRRGRKGT